MEWIAGDLLDARVLANLMQDVDTVFHAGGQLDGPPAEVHRSLVDGTARVLDLATHARLVYLSSLVVLDTSSPGAQIDATTPLEPAPARRGSYTQAKSAAEALVRTAADRQDVVIVRPGLVIVPGQNAMPPSVALRMGPFWLPVGPGRAELPVVEVETVAEGLIAAAERAPRGAVVHLINQVPVTRRELFERLRDGLGLLLPVGPLVLGAAIAAMGFSNTAYRTVAAGRPHRWIPSSPSR